ncbi:DUF802 domain-containing protein [Zoogloea sp.]|uniref:DUF802 domain-containing protein n=1 Tax=Zoogloea sp. TaxID=49181 RepID=UPI0014161810|nr:MAG: DUF802 domain-containing protein [Zoogloea sp.]
MNTRMCWAAFLVGLAAVVWVGAGYIGGSPLALAMTLIIGVVYVIGALELRRFHQATASLAGALAAIPEGLSNLDEWLRSLHPTLQNPVRLRIEGERVGLPAPAVTPYLVGLLVLLGMLGTFLGMVVTLNGAVLALESTTDLQTIRASLAAPVKGLGVAFGTSVAGVAASAMLGLVSALCRRERLQVSQGLDGRIATVLRRFSMAHQRQETFQALQLQARALPEVVGSLQAMMAQLERHNQQLSERLLANQESHYREAKGLYTGLAAAVDVSLRESLSESARLAGETIRPVVEATLSGIARETRALQGSLGATVETQLNGLAERFDRSVTGVADTWTQALATHAQTSETLHQHLRQALDAYADSFEQRSAGLLASVAQTHSALQTDLATTVAAAAQDTRRLHEQLAGTVEARLDGLSTRFEHSVGTVTTGWTEALERHERTSGQLSQDTRNALSAFVARFETGATELLATVREAHAGLQADSAAHDQQRLAAFTETVASITASLQREWQEAGVQAAARQQQLCETLAGTAREIGASTREQATRTIDEVARLMQTAAEAPRAAAEVIGQLRQELSASMARDNTLLEERSRIMETLGSLLDAINHASTEQRGAIDALVASSSSLLERVGSRFEARVDTEAGRLAELAAQVSSGAVDVASLGDAFGFAVELFSESNGKLMSALERVEAALGASVARSDEQLAYYVAQAREVIDLSILSQRQIVEDLQRLGSQPAAVTGGA